MRPSVHRALGEAQGLWVRSLLPKFPEDGDSSVNSQTGAARGRCQVHWDTEGRGLSRPGVDKVREGSREGDPWAQL